MWYPTKTPFFIKSLFPKLLWNYPPTMPPRLYLTFDDGPHTTVTDWVLEQLSHYNARATFFCIGRNLARHPDVYSRILAAGHTVGNHTYNHLNGWKHDTVAYMENVAQCAELIPDKLFRPPYGRLRNKQYRQLLKKQYRIVMWDVMPGDFDTAISGAQCWKNILRFSKNGSIIVLHDSTKAWQRLEYVLPRLLEHYSRLGFQFERIE